MMPSEAKSNRADRSRGNRLRQVRGRAAGTQRQQFFVVAAAQEAANRTIEEAQIIRLSVEDQRAFADAILDPPPPAPALIRAAEAHRRLIREP
jgi:uncharacterized protein (DUF1778 family)